MSAHTVLLLALALALPVEPVALQDEQRLDPIVTGVRVTGDQMNKWQEMKALADRCPTGLEQPFPGSE